MLATFSRAGLRSSAWLPGLPALAGGMRMLCTKVTETKMPDGWRKLSAHALAQRAHKARAHWLPVRTEYTDLEVWDTAELKQLEKQMAAMKERLVGLRATAVEERRPVIKKNCDFDQKRLEKIQRWLDVIYRDERRKW